MAGPIDLTPVNSGLATSQAPQTNISPQQVASPYRELAGNLDKIGEVTDTLAVKAAEDAGSKSVSRDADGSLVVQKPPLLFGPASEAFARASRMTYLAQAEPEIENKLTELRLQHANDPATFQHAAKVYGDEYLGRMTDPTLRGPVQKIIESNAGQNYRSLLVQTDATNVQGTLTSLKSRISDSSNRLADLAFQGGTDTEEYKTLQGNISAMYSELGTDPRMGYPKARIDSELTEMTSQHKVMALSGQAIRMMDDSSSPTARADAKKFLIDKIYGDAGLNLTMAQRHQAVTTAMGLMEARSSENKALIDANKAQATALLTGLHTNQPYNAIAVNDSISNAAKIGDAESYYKLTFAKGMHDWDATVRTLPLPQQLSALSSLDNMRTPFENRLAGSESSGDPRKINQLGYAGLYQFGAPRLADIGIYTPGPNENLKEWSKTSANAPGKWTGTFNIPGFPDVKTIDDFRNNPAAQQAAFGAHQGKMDAEIKQLGLDRYEGQTVGGVTINRAALYGMMHLGGAQGTANALASGGANAARDANGTSVMDYARKFGAGGAGQAWFDEARTEQVSRFRDYLKGQGTEYVNTAVSMLQKTGDVPDAMLSNISNVLRETGQDDLRKKMDVALMAHYGVKDLDKLPESVRQSWVTRSLRGGANNFDAANAALNMTPEEKALYQRHLTNLNGPGGVNNPDGTRSTLFQTTVEHDGKFYTIPTVFDGKVLWDKSAPDPAAAAVEKVKQIGWDKFPSYKSEAEAEARYNQMHEFIAKDRPAGRASVESPIAFQVHEHMAAQIEANAKAMQETPYSTYAVRTQGKPPPAYNFDDPGNVAAVAKARSGTQAAFTANDRTGPVSVFEGKEGEAFANVLTNGDSGVAAQTLGGLSSLPTDIYQATLAQKPVAGAIAGMMGSKDPVRMSAAMSAADKLWRESPADAKTTLGDAAITKMQAWQGLRGNFTAPEIAERLNASDDPSTLAARKAAKKEAEEETDSLKPADMAYKLGTGWPGIGRLTGSTPGAPFDSIKGGELVADYRATYTALRTYGVDADKASDLAVQRLQSTWGVSAAAGNQVMKNPPERSYPAIGGSHDWLGQDLTSWITRQAGPQFAAGDRSLEVGIGGAGQTRRWSVEGMISDGQTQAEISAGRPPSYRVALKNADGTLRILDSRVAFDPSDHIAEHGAHLEQRRQSADFLRVGQFGNEMPLP